MDITWYLVLSALLFAVGAAGVLIRRSPLVILLCLELMLNAGNLALLAFRRAGSIVCGLGFRRLPGRSAGWIATAAIFAAFAAAIGALIALQDHSASDRELTSSLYDYASAARLDIQLGILVDPLSVFMALVVSGVSALIHLYSVTYMTSDRGFDRYFSY